MFDARQQFAHGFCIFGGDGVVEQGAAFVVLQFADGVFDRRQHFAADGDFVESHADEERGGFDLAAHFAADADVDAGFVCGEMGGQIEATPLLVGMGCRPS